MAKRNGTPVAILKPDPKNARKHGDRNQRVIRQSLQEVGAGRSILVDADGVIRAGNGVFEQAQALGLKVKVVESDGQTLIAVKRNDLKGKKAERAAILDNRAGELAEWDVDVLAERAAILDNRAGELAEWDVDVLADLAANDAAVLEGLFDDRELRDLLGDKMPGKEETADPAALVDRAGELQKKWKVQRGDLWECGKHRLLCGDSTNAADVQRVMGGAKAQLCFTSPPYWVGKSYETQTTLTEVRSFVWLIAANVANAVTRDGGRIVVNCSTASAKAINKKADVETLFTLAWWQEAFRDKDWLMRHCRVWLKHGDMGAPRVAASSDVVDQHWEVIPEFLPTFYNPDGLRRGQEKIGMKWAQLGVWTDIHGERSADGTHVAAFPIELPSRYVQLYTQAGETVLEPFAGSGTTLIAAEQAGRIGRGIEIEPKYIAVALERLSLLGLDCKRISDGEEKRKARKRAR